MLRSTLADAAAERVRSRPFGTPLFTPNQPIHSQSGTVDLNVGFLTLDPLKERRDAAEASRESHESQVSVPPPFTAPTPAVTPQSNATRDFSQDELDAHAKTNRDAMPPMQVSPRPGPGDWIAKSGSVCDGDLITIRNLAWKGCSLQHSWNGDSLRANGDHVEGMKLKGGDLTLRPVRMDNAYSFVLRKLVWSDDKCAWVMIKWDAWKDRAPITKSDYFCLLVPNEPVLAVGTRSPPSSLGNNGDYKVGLYPFPVCTSAELGQHTLKGTFRRMLSLGFWRESKDHIDFLAQSTCVWSFHEPGVSKSDGPVQFGASPINIRNVWTEVKARETTVWDFAASMVGVFPVAGLIANTISKTFKGGRNLTQAAGSDGRVVKLALSNKDRDDKALWIIDGWHGNHYPVQRALVPEEAPPGGGVEVPNLEHQITHPPPSLPGMTLDPTTGTNRATGLEKDLGDQNPFTMWDWLCYLVFKKRWAKLSITESLGMIAITAVVGVLGVELFADLFQIELKSLLGVKQ